jgi:hypothetical protein
MLSTGGPYNMTTMDLVKLRGRKGLLDLGKLSVPINVIDSRTAFGRIDLLVRPINGRGEQWVSSDKVLLDNSETKVR